MEVVQDPKGLVINYWNRYMKQFQPYITKHDLWKDLNQEIQYISMELEYIKDIVEAGKIIGKRFREFLKSIGFRKIGGKWALDQLLVSDVFWSVLEEKGKTPDGYESDKYVVFVGRNKNLTKEKKCLIENKMTIYEKRAFEACGHADWRLCNRCKKYDEPEKMVRRSCGIKSIRNFYVHIECLNKKITEEEKERINEERKKRISAYSRQYAEKNKERIREIKRAYDERNREKIKLKNKKYNENLKELRKLAPKKVRIKMSEEDKKEKRKVYYQKNKEKINKYAKKYYQKNKEKWKEYNNENFEVSIAVNMN